MQQLEVEYGSGDAVLVDKLAARCAAKRNGVFFYGRLLAMHAARGGFAGGPSPADLAGIQVEEQAHYELVSAILCELGEDPARVTASARLESRACEAVAAVITNPEATLVEALEATLVAEIIDQEGWYQLIELAESRALPELAEDFQAALDIEVEHLRALRRWIAAGQRR